MAIPCVLNPGKFLGVVSVTLKPKGLALVFPGTPRVDVLKWDATTVLGFTQGNPLRKNLEVVSATQKSCRGSGSAHFAHLIVSARIKINGRAFI